MTQTLRERLDKDHRRQVGRGPGRHADHERRRYQMKRLTAGLTARSRYVPHCLGDGFMV